MVRCICARWSPWLIRRPWSQSLARSCTQQGRVGKQPPLRAANTFASNNGVAVQRSKDAEETTDKEEDGNQEDDDREDGDVQEEDLEEDDQMDDGLDDDDDQDDDDNQDLDDQDVDAGDLQGSGQRTKPNEPGGSDEQADGKAAGPSAETKDRKGATRALLCRR